MVDANILIAGVVWPRGPHEVLEHALAGDFQLILSRYIINQARRRIKNRFAIYLPPFEEFLQKSEYELVKEPMKKQLANAAGLVRDPTDIPIALAAIGTKVDYLVSEDKDLTARDESTAKLRQQLTVYLSGAFLRQVMGWSGEELEQVRKRNWDDLPEE